MEYKWIKKDTGFELVHVCPRCGERALQKLVWIDTVEEIQSNFCPNCGIKLQKTI